MRNQNKDLIKAQEILYKINNRLTQKRLSIHKGWAYYNKFNLKICLLTGGICTNRKDWFRIKNNE